MKVYINKEEIDVRIKLNFSRLSDREYDIDNVFKGDDASWPGDWKDVHSWRLSLFTRLIRLKYRV